MSHGHTTAIRKNKCTKNNFIIYSFDRENAKVVRVQNRSPNKTVESFALKNDQEK